MENWSNIFLLTLVVFCALLANGSDVFHVKSKITFYPDETADFFGYSVLLSDMGFHVGAPKAKSRIRSAKPSFPGAIFTCPLNILDSSNVTCHPVVKERKTRSYLPLDYYKNDMWFGAQIAATPDKKLLSCAYRSTEPYQDKHLLANGVCYTLGKELELPLLPLKDPARQASITDGRKKEYGAYGTHLNYYAYGQAGMSMAYTKDHHFIIGAPGVLQWTGIVVDYKHTPKTYTFERQTSSNPYYTKDLGPDDYLGYSVDSGVFYANGSVLYISGAPRSRRGYGQVFVFNSSVIENRPMDIKARLVGPQLGGYFGAALCALDLNGDGISDLLVGAPNYATRDNGELTYDQGAVFAYITVTTGSGFRLENAGSVGGSGESGARFGTAIADLGDIDGDGITDVAIGAPWENDGIGVVYIYRGSEKGLKGKYYQRIFADGARSFGISIARGYDVDRNKCNDLAIGAHNSGTAYIYRSIPTIQVISAIKVPDAKSLRQTASNFTALFCVTVPPNKLWTDVAIKMKATVTVDPNGARAFSLDDTDYTVAVKPGLDTCDEQVISVNNQSDLSKPILLKFDVKPVTELDDLDTFPYKGARLSENSVLTSSFLIQLLSDCGDDLICTPWLEMTLEPLGNETTYTPGIESKLGAKVTVTNLAEPAYSVKLHAVLPRPPKRLDSSCSLKNLDLICDLPAPLKRNESIVYEIELDYTWDGAATELMIAANIEDPLYLRNVSSGAKELLMKIEPYSTYNYTGKTETNATVVVTRETLSRNGDVLFTHYFEFTNYGPSDLYNLRIGFLLPDEVSPVIPIEGATQENNTFNIPPFMLRANATTAYHLPLRFNLTKYHTLLEENEAWNITSSMFFFVQYGSTRDEQSVEVTTTLILEPATPIWPLIVAVVTGLLVLALIILALYKLGFFSRQKKEDLKQLIENNASQEGPGSSNSSNQLSMDMDGSNHGLVSSDAE